MTPRPPDSTPCQKTPRRPRRKRRVVVLLVIVTAAALAAWEFYPRDLPDGAVMNDALILYST